jgi:hypothetical protein
MGVTLHLGILLHVCDGGERDAEIRSWAPEICCSIVSQLCVPDLIAFPKFNPRANACRYPAVSRVLQQCARHHLVMSITYPRPPVYARGREGRVERTSRAKVIQDFITANLRIDSLDRRSHFW